jgi:ABC-2 type transport system ATP-binding protein
MIVVDRVSKYYGEHAAVRDLDFTIEAGQCVGFLGLNGAGKSTTLRLLSCLLLPTSGRITINGFDAEADPHEIRKLIGYLPDTPPLYPEMTVERYLRFAGKLRRMSRAELEKRLPEALERTALTAVAEQPINTLSHGYKQRVGIAQAIIHRPALLILDEPIQGLDPVQIVEMRELIRALSGEHTILLSSHNLLEVERTCDRVLMLSHGRIVEQGAGLGAPAGQRDTARKHGAELEVRGSEEAVRAALADLEGVAITMIAPLGDELLRVKIESPADARELVAARVVERGLGLRRLERASTDLEEAFLQFRDAGAEEARA